MVACLFLCLFNDRISILLASPFFLLGESKIHDYSSFHLTML